MQKTPAKGSYWEKEHLATYYHAKLNVPPIYAFTRASSYMPNLYYRREPNQD